METLWRIAGTLNRRAAQSNPGASALPPMVFVTDPERTPDPAAVAERLPPGAGVIYRAFGAGDALQIALGLRRICERRGLILLIGADADLAARAGAHGVHLPERDVNRGVRLRARHRAWLITGAAHSARALDAAARAGLDAALVSPVFPSNSSSAKTVLTPIRLARLTAKALLPVYALGGVKAATAKRLIGTGVAGLAAVEGLL
jgi:thiamine-phosphate pyrophosphorylase